MPAQPGPKKGWDHGIAPGVSDSGSDWWLTGSFSKRCQELPKGKRSRVDVACEMRSETSTFPDFRDAAKIETDENLRRHSRSKNRFANYSYPVSAVSALLFGARYRLADRWFNFEPKPGDGHETMRFEARFRKFGPQFIEAWYEVIFWNLARAGRRGEYFTARMFLPTRERIHRCPRR